MKSYIIYKFADEKAVTGQLKELQARCNGLEQPAKPDKALEVSRLQKN